MEKKFTSGHKDHSSTEYKVTSTIETAPAKTQKPKISDNRTKDNENKKIQANKYTQLVGDLKLKETIHCCDACQNPITRRVIYRSQCDKQYHINCIPAFHKQHILQDDGDSFQCHKCYECNTDSSGGESIFDYIFKGRKAQGF